MKKQPFSFLLVLTLIFAAFTAGMFLGKNLWSGDSVIVSVPAAMQTEPAPTQPLPQPETQPVITFPIDLNTAGEAELRALPGIGEKYAERILTYREEHGAFTKPEELLNIQGIGEKRLEGLLDYITIGGTP